MATAARKVTTLGRLLAPTRSSSASRVSEGGRAATPPTMSAGVSTQSLVRTFKTPSGAIMQRPERSRPFDVAMSSVTIFTGIACGAWIARETAAKLEDLDVFVPDDDDDDD